MVATEDNKINIVVKPPSECNEAEIKKFYEYLIEQGEVGVQGLCGRIERAVGLAFLYVGSDLGGIAAMKCPDIPYKMRVFKKARVLESESYNKELGWVYVPERYRGNKHSGRLVEAALHLVNNENVFATTSDDRMRSTLVQFNFVASGNSFQSRKGHSLHLYLRRSR
jgi:hypothetical protein